MAEIKIYTTTWCPDCRLAKLFLDRRGVAYDEVNIETTPGGPELVMAANQGKRNSVVTRAIASGVPVANSLTSSWSGGSCLLASQTKWCDIRTSGRD